MPPVDPTYKNPTGKQALLSSFNAWLETNVPSGGSTDFTYSFLQQLQPQKMARVEVSEYQYFTPGQTAFGGIIFPAAGAQQQSLGVANRMMVQIDIFADQAPLGAFTGTPTSLAARKVITQIRDRIVYGLVNAGVTDSTGAVAVPPIPVLDPENSNFDTGTLIRVLTEEDNWKTEKYFPPSPEKPSIHQYQLLFKLEWYEMRS